MLTEKQEKICAKYKAHDKDGFVHCNECPLVLDAYTYTCRAFMHYDRGKKRWVEDNEV